MVAARSSGIPIFNGGEDEPIVSLPIAETLLAHGADASACMDYGGTTVLQLAVYSGSAPLVRLLLKHGANPHGNPEGMSTPMRDAVAQGNLAIVQMLLKAGAKLEADPMNGSLLATAVETGSLDFVKFLAAHNVSVNQSDSQGITPLMHAAGNGQLEMARFLLTKGARVNARDYDGDTPLSFAISRDKPEIVHLLLASGAKVNMQDTKGATPLVVAASDSADSERQYLKLLLDHGADPNLHGEDGTALMWAAASGQLDEVELLLAHGADARISGGRNGSALLSLLDDGNVRSAERYIYAMGGGATEAERTTVRAQAEAADVAIAQALFSHGADVKTGYNAACLLNAAQGGSLALVRLLLAHGAVVDARVTDTSSPSAKLWVQTAKEVPSEAPFNRRVAKSDGLGVTDATALMVAARGGHAAVVQCLLDAGAEAGAHDRFGQTALMQVALAGRNDIARRLPGRRQALLRKPVPGLKLPGIEVSPAEAAAWRKWAFEGDSAVIAALLAKGVDLEAADEDGRTALMAAAVKSSPQVVQTLLRAGAAVNARDKSGRTAIMLLAGDGRLAHARDLFLDPPQTTIARAKNQSLASLRTAQKAATAKDLAETERQQAAVIRAQTAEDVAVLRALLAAGADPTLIDRKGRTALTIAEAAHHPAAAAVLRKPLTAANSPTQ